MEVSLGTVLLVAVGCFVAGFAAGAAVMAKTISEIQEIEANERKAKGVDELVCGRELPFWSDAADDAIREVEGCDGSCDRG